MLTRKQHELQEAAGLTQRIANGKYESRQPQDRTILAPPGDVTRGWHDRCAGFLEQRIDIASLFTDG